jgi:hypothetical protein
MNDGRCVSPDWEIECKRLTEMNEVLKAKLHDSDCLRREQEMEIARLRAQMDVVHLIFGKGR